MEGYRLLLAAFIVGITIMAASLIGMHPLMQMGAAPIALIA